MPLSDPESHTSSIYCTSTHSALLPASICTQVFAALSLALERPELKSIAVIGCDDGRAYVPDMMAARRPDEQDTVAELEVSLRAFSASRRAQPVVSVVGRAVESSA